MQAPKARGELSQELIGALRSGTASWDEVANGVPTDADDLHLSLWTMYELSIAGSTTSTTIWSGTLRS